MMMMRKLSFPQWGWLLVAADDSRGLPVSDHHMGNTPTWSSYHHDDDGDDNDNDDYDDDISAASPT